HGQQLPASRGHRIPPWGRGRQRPPGGGHHQRRPGLRIRPGRRQLDGQRRDGVARYLRLAGAGERGQHLPRSEVEDQLVIGDGEVLIVRRVAARRGQYRGTQGVLAFQVALDQREDRVQGRGARGEEIVESDRLLGAEVVVERLVPGRRVRSADILEELEHHAAGVVRWLTGTGLLGGR